MIDKAINNYELGELNDDDFRLILDRLHNYRYSLKHNLNEDIYFLMTALHQPLSDILQLSVYEKQFFINMHLKQLKEQQKAMESVKNG